MRISVAMLLVGTLGFAPLAAAAEPAAFKVLPNYSRATFKTDAPLETIVGTTAGPGVSGTVALDLAQPQGATGVIRVDLTTVHSGVVKRDADMKGPDYLDTANEANRYAVFEVKGVEVAGPLEPGREVRAKVKGILTIKGKPVERLIDARITYVRLTPQELENYKRFGYTEDVLRVRAKFDTTFTSHGMQVPQLLTLKVSNDIELETDLTLVRQ
jgi:polyisoprenoid-binding protein YceI